MNPPAEGRQAGVREPTAGVGALPDSPEFRGPVDPSDDHDHANDHLALIYEDRDDQFAAVVPFVRGGLERGERCLYVADDRSREEVLEALRESEVDVDAARESGALSVLTPAETYLRTGEFDREEMLTFWEDALEEARADGFAGIRAAAEMTWALDSETGTDELADYEALLNPLYEDDAYTVLCQYNRARFPADVVDDVIATHPLVVRENTVSRNVYYTPPEKFFRAEDPEETVERKLRTLEDRTRTKTALREHKAYLQRLNEITADGTLSFEESVERLLELGCDYFDLAGGALSHLPSEDGPFAADVTFGPELSDVSGVFPVQPEEGCFCRRAISRDEPTAVPNVADVGWDDTATAEQFGFEAYFGIRVTAGDDPYGTLWFYGTSPRAEPFSDDERTVLELMGRWVSYELERRRREADIQRSKERLERIIESSQDAIFILDPHDEEILETNPAGCEMLGYEKAELLSLEPSDVHPDEMDEFRRFVDDVYDEGSGWTEELTCRHRDGRRIPAEISGSRIEYDGRQCLLALVRDVSERRERERCQRRLYEVAADPDRSFEEKLQAIFELGCDRFDMEMGGLATVDPENDHFEVEATNGDHDHLAPGRQYPLSETFCRAAVDEDPVCAITTPEAFEGKLCYDRFGVRTYLGTYLELENTDDRTFWFVSAEPREEAISEAERTFHHLMGQWVQYELERRHHADQLTALNNLNAVVRDINRSIVQQSTREEIERVVCERLAESDSYEFAWFGRTDEETGRVVPTTTANAQGYLDDVTVTADASDAGRGPTGTALRTGEPQFAQTLDDAPEYEPWREQVAERGVDCSAAIPIAYEGERYGVLNVYTARERAFDGEEREVITQLGEIIGLAVTAVEHERKLEHERERLEFVNRLVRHNLLNSLNVVAARAEILDGHVDAAAEPHLETVRNRTDDMIDLVETLRSLMKVIVKEEPHELEPVDLGAVLTDEVDRASQAFPRAEFETRGSVERAGAVLADDLLEEVFENVLTNAVQHSDKATPRITVEVERDDDVAAVRVADDGPGVPDEMKDRIFRKGEKSFDSPGTGFGLHLVHEIVDAYDGSVAVEDNAPEGAEFTISIPRATDDR